jgi:hypothetical protein
MESWLAHFILYMFLWWISFIHYFFGGWDWGLNSGFHTCKVVTLSPGPCLLSIFALVIFEDGVLRTSCLGWLWTLILPISASQVARITGVSHWHPADFFYFLIFGGTGVWLRASHLLGRCSFTWATPSAPYRCLQKSLSYWAWCPFHPITHHLLGGKVKVAALNCMHNNDS